MPTKDVNKLLKGVSDVILAAVDSSGNASPAQVGDTFPLLSLGYLEQDALQSEEKKLEVKDAGGQTLQLGQVNTITAKSMSGAGLGINSHKKFKNSLCNIFGFGSLQSHRLDKFLMNVETPQELKKDGKSVIILSSERKVSPDESLGSLGQSATAFATTAAYRYNQFIKNIRQENLVFAFLPILGSFGQDAKAYDASDNRYTGTVYNGATWGTAPDGVNSKLTFDGVNDYVDFGNIIQLDALSDWVFESWIKILTSDSAGVTVPIFCNKSCVGADKGIALYRDTSTDCPEVRISDGTTNFKTFDSSPLRTSNGWTHLAISVKRSGNATLYRNGNQVGTPVTISGISDLTNTNAFLVAKNNGTSLYSNVEIGTVRAYRFENGTLPTNIATVIASHYSAERSIFGV